MMINQAGENAFPPNINKEVFMTEAEKRACAKYQREKLKSITIRVKPEELERYKAAAKKSGMSFRAWMMSAMDDKIGGDCNA